MSFEIVCQPEARLDVVRARTRRTLGASDELVGTEVVRLVNSNLHRPHFFFDACDTTEQRREMLRSSRARLPN
jgi:hypothetical protein